MRLALRMRWLLIALLVAFSQIAYSLDAATGTVHVAAVVDAASFSVDRPITPGTLVTLFGQNLANGVFENEQIPLPLQLGSTRVSVNGVDAPLLFVSPGQINLQFPYELTGNSASIVVDVDGTLSQPLTVPLTGASPAIFSVLSNGVGPGAILHPDWRLVSRENPLSPRGVVQIFATGLGAVAPPVSSGEPAPPDPLSELTSAVRVLFDGRPGDVLFAGLAPFFVGLYQINARAPAVLDSPYPQVTLEIGSQISNPVTAGGPGLQRVNPPAVPTGSAAVITLLGANLAPQAELEINGQRLTAQAVSGQLDTLQVSVPGDFLTTTASLSLTAVTSEDDREFRSNLLTLHAAPTDSVAVGASEVTLVQPLCSTQPASREVTILNRENVPLPWTATTSGEPWLTVSPEQGTAPSTLTVRATRGDLAPGTYSGQVRIETAFGSASELLLQVNLVVEDSGEAGKVAPNVYTLNSTQRVLQNAPLPAVKEITAALLSAKREFEAFQIVIFGEPGGLSNVNAELSQPLVGPGCTALSPDNVVFYREHFVNITRPTKDGRGGSKPGIYPDALIPFKNPFTGQPIQGGTYVSAPFNVAPGQNQVLYVEVYVPPGTPAGQYEGSVRVTHNNGTTLADVPVTLNVADFELPEVPSLRSQFQAFDGTHDRSVAAYFSYLGNESRHQSVAVAFDENLISHRIMAPSRRGTGFTVDQSTGRIRRDPEQEARLEALLSRPEFREFDLNLSPTFPFDDPLTVNRAKTLAYLRDAYEWLDSRGFIDKVTIRVFDEPNTELDFRLTRDYADLIHEANPNFIVPITTVFTDPNVARYLHGHLDIYIVGFWTFDPVAAAARLAAGDEFWTYTALLQDNERRSAFWLIDEPLSNYRASTWTTYRYGGKGIQYWTTDNWREIMDRGSNPWVDACSFSASGACFNGDGLMVYPGREINYIVPQGAHGPDSSSPVWGPVASLRLKAIRDATEDFDWLTLAAAKDPDGAMEAAIHVGCNGDPNPGNAARNCFFHWNESPEAFHSGRLHLLPIITGE